MCEGASMWEFVKCVCVSVKTILTFSSFALSHQEGASMVSWIQ